MDGYGWRSLFLLVQEGESSSACDSFDGWSPALSFFFIFFLFSFLCSRKIMMSLGMTTKSRITLVSQHVQSATGSEKIIALFSIYEYPTEYRVSSKCTTPSGTKVYFSTKSREHSLGPLTRDVTFGPWGPMTGSYSRSRGQHVLQCFLERIVGLPTGSRIKSLLFPLIHFNILYFLLIYRFLNKIILTKTI